MASNWFYAKQGKQIGPVSSGQLKEMARQGQLLATDMIWKEGMPSWVQAGSLPDLFQSAGSFRPGATMPPAVPGAPPFPSGSGEPQKSKFPKWALLVGIPAGLLFLCCGGCVAMMSLSGDGKSRPFAVGGGKSKAGADLPADQQEFIRVVESFIQPYESAPNELKKSALRADRKKALQRLLPSMQVSNWIGTVHKMETTSDGHAVFEVRLGGSKKIQVKTWNNAISNALEGKNTLIANGSRLYQAISNLSEGAQVVFSGSFISGDRDYIGEQSLTEEGSMSEPEFTFKFSQVSKKCVDRG